MDGKVAQESVLPDGIFQVMKGTEFVYFLYDDPVDLRAFPGLDVREVGEQSSRITFR